jgi:hypothetical protein
MSLFGNQVATSNAMNGFGYGYMGLADQQMQQTQSAFEDLQRKMESDAKKASDQADTLSSMSEGTGVFSPAQGYDHSAAGAWAKENQGYVMQTMNLTM